MSNILGVSGSTILSQNELFGELFTYGAEHIEVGEFADLSSYETMMNMIKENNYSFSIHSPIIRGQSKYDLTEYVHFSSQSALSQMEAEAQRLSETACKYLLVHFPYFEKETGESRLDIIDDRLSKLAKIRDKYNIEIVCEPKLNGYMSAYSINVMDSIPRNLWAKYGIKVCIDLGDYFIAAKDNMEDMIYKWMDYIKVVHLHNVVFDDVRYRWVPIHPEFEQTKEYMMDAIIKNIAKKGDKYFIMEPTPHVSMPKEYMIEGIEWVKSII